jgi:alkylation response protein AidB-like acyl-CoA dehydrogenase
MSTLSSRDTEHGLIRESVAGIAGEFGHRYFVDRARRGEKATELWRALAKAGFVGVNLPGQYGGGGAGIAELQIVMEELAAAGCPLLMLVVSPGIVGSILSRHASADQRERWLPGIAGGSRQLAFAITEPDAGSNSHRIALRAERTDSGWVLNGAKYYISGCDEAGAVLTVARTGKSERDGRAELSLFIIPTDAPGLSWTAIETEIVSTEKQFSVFYDHVEVPDDALVGTEGQGLRLVFSGLNPERIMVAALANGIGRYALDRARSYALERSVWDAPIGSHQGLAHPLAEAYIQVELARRATERAGELYDAGADAAEAANIAKFAAAEAALRALDQAIQIHGGNGLSTEYGLADMWFLARLTRSAPVSREMILNFVAQHSLKLPRSY